MFLALRGLKSFSDIPENNATAIFRVNPLGLEVLIEKCASGRRFGRETMISLSIAAGVKRLTRTLQDGTLTHCERQQPGTWQRNFLRNAGKLSIFQEAYSRNYSQESKSSRTSNRLFFFEYFASILVSTDAYLHHRQG
jgi:hypothetical protein